MKTLQNLFNLEKIQEKVINAINEIKQNPYLFGDEEDGYFYVIDTLVSGACGTKTNKVFLEEYGSNISKKKIHFEKEIEMSDNLMRKLSKQLTTATKPPIGEIIIKTNESDNSICIFLFIKNF